MFRVAIICALSAAFFAAPPVSAQSDDIEIDAQALTEKQSESPLTKAAKALAAEKMKSDLEPLSGPIDAIDLSAETALIEKIKTDPAFRISQFDLARAEHHDGDGKVAIRIFTELANNANHTPSMRWLARMAFGGEAQEAYKALGFEWLNKAALAGDVLAMEQTGGLALEGEGTPQSAATARHWFLYAADRGSKNVDGELMRMFDKGIGGPADPAMTLVFAKRRADRYKVDGLYFMGVAYRDGNGVKQDLEEARLMFEFAKEKGDADSAAALADFPETEPETNP